MQKSIGGVWPLAAMGDELVESTVGLASRCESVGEAKARRKPTHRWLSREIGGGFPQNSNLRKQSDGNTCRWKALRAKEAVRVDVRSAGRVLAPRKPSGFPDDAGRDRERQRASSPTLHAVENAAVRERRPERCSAPRQKWRRAVRGGA